MKKIINLFLLALVITIVISGCKIGKTEVENIVLSKETIHLEPGGMESLSAQVLPENADNKEITWISSDESVAIVKDGFVQALSDGDSKITAKTSNGVTSEICWVFVETPKAYDSLNQEEKMVFNNLTDKDGVKIFKNPSSITLREVQLIEEPAGTDQYGSDTYFEYYLMEISAENGFGGVSVDTYRVSWGNITKTSQTITSPDQGLNIANINAAIKEFVDEKGW